MRASQLFFAVATCALLGCERAPSELPPGPAPPPPAPAAPAGPQGSGPNRDVSRRPEITIPSGSPPSELQREDLVTGSGAEAHAGQRVTVRYSGMAWSTRREFDSSWNAGRTFPFQLGSGQVIRGWDQGVAGMRVGGRRQLTIPAALGYGERGSPPNIGPNETLVFIVDLVSIDG